MKAKLALLEGSPFTSKAPKTFQSKNKGLVAETFNWDEEEVLDKEEETRVQVLMALADDELSVGKNHARNDEWIDITIKSEQIPSQKKKIFGGEQLIETSSVSEVKENSFIPDYLDYDHEMILKSIDWVERLNPDSKLPNTGRILVPENHSPRERPGLGKMNHTMTETKEYSNKIVSRPVTDHNTELILESKAKPFPPCTHCGFDDHRPDDYRNYPECEIYGSYDHFTSGDNNVFLVRGGALA
ncbi:hypothetical protein Tco_0024335 [Tanacetum coccineum]